MDPVRQSKKVGIYILDDDHISRDELRNLLRSAGYHATCFADKIALLQGIREELPACVYLRQSSIGSLELMLAELASYRVPAVVISDRGDIPTAVRIIKAGAVDFISGRIESQEIIGRLEKTLSELQRGANANASLSNQYLLGELALSSREKEILEHVANGFSSKQIGTMLRISWRTVDDHRGRILQKLGARNTADLMISIMNRSPKSRS